MPITLSSLQDHITTMMLEEWHDERSDLIAVTGYAGTGKTTIIGEFVKLVRNYFPQHNKSVAFLTFTGKAATVLFKKLQQCNAYQTNDYCGTVHRLMYEPEVEFDTKINAFKIIGWKKRFQSKSEIPYNLFVIDEASMISDELLEDIRSYGIPIIAFGDPGQLPPVNGNCSILDNANYHLHEIHRQAWHSPIIKLSQYVRDYGCIPYQKDANFSYSDKIFKVSWTYPGTQQYFNNNIDFRDPNVITLCGFNSTRCQVNDMIRRRHRFNLPVPYAGERVICLSNNYESNIMNGQIATLVWLMNEGTAYRTTLDIDGQYYESYMSTECFGKASYESIFTLNKMKKKKFGRAKQLGFNSFDYFDYGYATTVHKSQGSEWDKVILFEQRASSWDDSYNAKWLYTAITRAKEKLLVISDKY